MALIRLNGFLVVRKPEWDFSSLDERIPYYVLPPLSNGVVYHGLERYTFIDFFDGYYEHSPHDLSQELRNIYKTMINDFKAPVFSQNYLRFYNDALKVLLYSNQGGPQSELLGFFCNELCRGMRIKCQRFPTNKLTRLGYDPTASGGLSGIAEGIFSTFPGVQNISERNKLKGEFDRWAKKLNRNGLFDKKKDAMEYAIFYAEKAKEHNIETISFDCFSLLYRIKT